MRRFIVTFDLGDIGGSMEGVSDSMETAIEEIAEILRLESYQIYNFDEMLTLSDSRFNIETMDRVDIEGLRFTDTKAVLAEGGFFFITDMELADRYAESIK